MRYNFIVCGVFCLVFLGFTPPAIAQQVSATLSGSIDDVGPLPRQFVEIRGHQFYLNGKPFYYAGFNTYYMMVFAADSNLRYAIDEILFEANNLELKVMRTWAFNDGPDQWNALQTNPGVYQEYVFEGLDFVLAMARANKVRVVLTLVNNWDDYGGMNQYVDWSPTASMHDDFYTDDNCRQWYKDHISTVLNRVNTINGRLYKEDPTIFAWELANEPNCESDSTGDTLQAWIEEMSAYIKSIDVFHMVTVGSEGYYGPSEWWKNPHSWMQNKGADFIRNHTTIDVDYATTHVWPDIHNYGFSDAIFWVRERIKDSETVLGKPLVIAEMGKYRPLSYRDAYYQAWYDEIYSSAYNGGAGAGSNFWILYHDDYPDYDGFGVYYPDDFLTLTIIYNEAMKMDAL